LRLFDFTSETSYTHRYFVVSVISLGSSWLASVTKQLRTHHKTVTTTSSLIQVYSITRPMDFIKLVIIFFPLFYIGFCFGLLDLLPLLEALI